MMGIEARGIWAEVMARCRRLVAAAKSTYVWALAPPMSSDVAAMIRQKALTPGRIA